MNPTDPMKKVERELFAMVDDKSEHLIYGAGSSAAKVYALNYESPSMDKYKWVRYIPESAYTEALEQIEKMKKALEFYADKGSWAPADAYAENTLIVSSDHYCLKGHFFTGGKSARAALKDLEDWVRG